MPFFSVVLPVYNVEAFLDRCAKSVLEQDFSDYELIFVDDGSTDGSGAICDRYAEMYPFAKVVHKENGGLSSARNAGTEAASGRYILWLDSDDWVETNLLSKLYEILAVNAVDFVKYNFYRHEGKDIPMAGGILPGIYPEKTDVERLLNQAVYGNGYLLSACMHCIRRELIVENGLSFVSERIVGSEDYLFILEMMMQAQSGAVLDDCLYHYYCRPGSLTQSVRNDIPERYTALYRYLLEYIKEHPQTQKFEQAMHWYFVWKLIHNCCLPAAYHRPNVDGYNSRKRVKEILRFPALKEAAGKCSLQGRPRNIRLQFAAMKFGFEPLFYYLFVVKPRSKEV